MKLMRFDYAGDKYHLVDIDNPKSRVIHLILPWTFEEMGKLGILTGEAKKDYEGAYG